MPPRTDETWSTWPRLEPPSPSSAPTSSRRLSARPIAPVVGVAGGTLRSLLVLLLVTVLALPSVSAQWVCTYAACDCTSQTQVVSCTCPVILSLCLLGYVSSPVACSCSAACSYGSWSDCSETCGVGNQTRTGACLYTDASTAADSLCGGTCSDTLEACNTDDCVDWEVGDWGSCSGDLCATTGNQTRSVTCWDYTTSQTSSACTTTEPVSSQTCDLPHCYSYIESGWSACSATCGGADSGVQTQTVTCWDDSLDAASDDCTAVAPASSRTCTPAQHCYEWQTDDWSACSVSCSHGTNSRSVWCQDTTNGTIVDSASATSFCAGTAPNSTRPCYTACTNNYLATLTLSPDGSSTLLDFGFDPATQYYSVQVSTTTSSINASATVADTTASLSWVQQAIVDLVYPTPQSIGLAVTSQAGDTRTYTVVLSRLPSTNAALSSLTPSSGALEPSFTNDTLAYALLLPNSVDLVSFVVVKADSRASTLTTWSPTSAEDELPVLPSTTTVAIVVTAQDGVTDRTYEVVISRAQLTCAVSTPQNGTLGSCTSGTIVSGTSCLITCDEGYEVDGLVTTCGAGVLTSNQTCVAKNCSFEAPYGGSAGSCTSTLTSGAACTIECNDGFVRGGGNETICFAGVLEEQTCTATGCATAAPVHGTANGCPSPLAEGANCTMACDTGYTISPTTITCVNNALSAVPVCNGDSCLVSAPTNGTLGTCPANGTLPHDETCNFSCHIGFAIAGDAEVTCEAGVITTSQSCVSIYVGVWSQSAYNSCSVDCGGGNQSTTVLCSDADGLCDPATKPAPLTRACNTVPCTGAANCTTPGVCDCATGLAPVSCTCDFLHGCSGMVNSTTCPTPCNATCSYGTFTTCTHTCGPESRNRSAACTWSDGQSASLTACYAGFGCNATTASCGLPNCFAWRNSSTWSTCSVTCGTGTQTRSVWCEDTTLGVVVADASCTASNKPTLNQTCAMPSCTTTIVVSPPVVTLAAPSSIDAGDILTLRATLVSIDASTSKSAIRYSWSASGAGSVSGLPITTSSASLTVNQSTPLATGNYTFTVVATDTSSLHVSAAGGSASGTASTRVRVNAAVSFVTVSTSPDPCSTSSPCLNGATCSSTQLAGDATSTDANGTVVTVSGHAYLLSCTCATTPGTFYGPTCAFSVLACPSCVSTFTGGTSITIYGTGMSSLTTVAVAGLDVTFSAPTTVSVSSNSDLAALMAASSNPLSEVESITFATPALVSVNGTDDVSTEWDRDEWSVSATMTPDLQLDFATTNPISAYKTLSLSAVMSSQTTVTELNYTSLLFYSSNDCITAGTFGADGLGGCLSCPSCCECPGGGRCWPKAGCWSYSEYQEAQSCTIPAACPGVISSVSAAVSTSSSDSTAATVDTQSCSTGYTGAYCTSCADGYYQLNGLCYYCGSSTDQTQEIVIACIVAVSAMFFLACCVAFLRIRPLAYAVQFFVLMQEFAAVGVAGVSDIPAAYGRKILATIFAYLNFINFDLELLRPGCAGIPTFNYVRKFALTILLMVVTALLFFIACIVRLCWRHHRARRHGVVGDEAHFIIDDDDQDATSPVRATTTILSRSSRMHRWKRDLKRFFSDAPWVDFKQRSLHAMLILLCIFYLRLATLQFQGFQCITAADPAASTQSNALVTYSLYLEEDMQTPCYKGEHLWTVVAICFLLVFYTAGYPIACFIFLMRAFATPHTPGVLGSMRRRFKCLRGRKKRTKRSVWAIDLAAVHQPQTQPQQQQPKQKNVPDLVMSPTNTDGTMSPAKVHTPSVEMQELNSPASSDASPKLQAAPAPAVQDDAAALEAHLRRDRDNKYGYLYVGYRADRFAACLAFFVVNLFTALVSVYLGSSSVLRQFLLSFLWTGQTIFFAVQLPFESQFQNVKKVAVSLASLAQVTVLLAMQDNGVYSEYFYVALCLFTCAAWIAAFRRSFPCRRCRGNDTTKTVDSTPELKGAPSPPDFRQPNSEDDEEEEEAEVNAPATESQAQSPAPPSAEVSMSAHRFRSQMNSRRDTAPNRLFEALRVMDDAKKMTRGTGGVEPHLEGVVRIDQSVLAAVDALRKSVAVQQRSPGVKSRAPLPPLRVRLPPVLGHVLPLSPSSAPPVNERPAAPGMTSVATPPSNESFTSPSPPLRHGTLHPLSPSVLPSIIVSPATIASPSNARLPDTPEGAPSCEDLTNPPNVVASTPNTPSSTNARAAATQRLLAQTPPPASNADLRGRPVVRGARARQHQRSRSTLIEPSPAVPSAIPLVAPNPIRPRQSLGRHSVEFGLRDAGATSPVRSPSGSRGGASPAHSRSNSRAPSPMTRSQRASPTPTQNEPTPRHYHKWAVTSNNQRTVWH